MCAQRISSITFTNSETNTSIERKAAEKDPILFIRLFCVHLLDPEIDFNVVFLTLSWERGWIFQPLLMMDKPEDF